MNSFKTWIEGKGFTPEQERARQWRGLFQGSVFLHSPNERHPEYVQKERELRDRIGQQFIQGQLTFDQANQLYSQQRDALRTQYGNAPRPVTPIQPAQSQASPNVVDDYESHYEEPEAPIDRKALAQQIRRFVPSNRLNMTVETLLGYLER